MNEFFCSSVIGARHIKQGTPKEDYGMCKETDSCKIFVLGDGHGDPNCFRSQVGSETICKLAVEALESFAATANPEDVLNELACKGLVKHFVNYLFGTWKGAVLQQLEEEPYSETELAYMEQERAKGSNTILAYDQGIEREHIFGTTFIAGLLTDKYLFLLHQGDGRCTVMHADGNYSEPVPWDDRCYDVFTTSVCDQDAIESCRYKVFDLSKERILACIISSDGVEDQFAADSDLVHSFFDDLMLYGIENGTEELINHLDAIFPELTAQGNGDDITLCGFYDPEAIEPFREKFSERKEQIRLQAQLNNVLFKLDSVQRSPKMEILKKSYEEAEKQFSTIKADYEKVCADQELLEKDLEGLQLNLPQKNNKSDILSSLLQKLSSIKNSFSSGPVQKFVEELTQFKKKKEALKPQLDSAEENLRKCEREYNDYSDRYNGLLAKKASLESELEKYQA